MKPFRKFLTESDDPSNHLMQAALFALDGRGADERKSELAGYNAARRSGMRNDDYTALKSDIYSAHGFSRADFGGPHFSTLVHHGFTINDTASTAHYHNWEAPEDTKADRDRFENATSWDRVKPHSHAKILRQLNKHFLDQGYKRFVDNRSKNGSVYMYSRKEDKQGRVNDMINIKTQRGKIVEFHHSRNHSDY